jgi:hypothetical protein
MLRKIAIGLAAAMIAMGGLTLNASAMRGGGPHGGGGFARAGGLAPHGGGRGFAMRGGRGLAMRGGRGFAMRGRGLAMRGRAFAMRGGRGLAMRGRGFGVRGGRAFAMRGFRHHHWGWRGRGGFSRFGAWGGSCWRWTPAGRVWVCGRGFGPSYGSWGWRGWHHRGGRVFGLRGGRRFR